MKEEVIGELTPAQLVYKLKTGGWFRPVGFDDFETVKSVEFDGNVLVVDHVTIKQPTVFLVQSGQVTVKEPSIRREQKKKIDGGGWQEIPSTRVALRLVDEEFVRLAKEASARRKEQERQQAEERERREAARKVAEAKQKEEDEKNRLARGVQFLVSLNEKYQGKKLSQQPIKLEDQTLVLQFEDGDTLKVDLFDSGEDWYSSPNHLVVNDISTASFKEAETPNRY